MNKYKNSIYYQYVAFFKNEEIKLINWDNKEQI